MASSYQYLQERPDWNMAQAYLIRLDQRLDERDNARVRGDLRAWYRALACILSNIHWKIEQKQDNKTESKESTMKTQLRKVKNNLKSSWMPNARDHMLSDTENQLEILDEQINDLLYEYDLLGMKKTHKDPGQSVRDAF